MATMAVANKQGNTSLQIAVAVTKQAMDQQQELANALLKMMDASTQQMGVGRIVDMRG